MRRGRDHQLFVISIGLINDIALVDPVELDNVRKLLPDILPVGISRDGDQHRDRDRDDRGLPVRRWGNRRDSHFHRDSDHPRSRVDLHGVGILHRQRDNHSAMLLFLVDIMLNNNNNIKTLLSRQADPFTRLLHYHNHDHPGGCCSLLYVPWSTTIQCRDYAIMGGEQ